MRCCESVSPSRYSGDVATAIIGPAAAGPYRILRLAYAPWRLHSVAGYTEFLSPQHSHRRARSELTGQAPLVPVRSSLSIFASLAAVSNLLSSSHRYTLDCFPGVAPVRRSITLNQYFDGHLAKSEATHPPSSGIATNSAFRKIRVSRLTSMGRIYRIKKAGSGHPGRLTDAQERIPTEETSGR